MKSILYKPVLFLGFILCICGCTPTPTQVLDSKIMADIRKGEVDQGEWNQLTDFVLANKTEFADLLTSDNTVDTKKLTDYIIKHVRGSQPVPQIYSPKNEASNTAAPHIKIFIENSGSMDGYVRGNQDFESVIGRLMVICKNYCADRGKSNLEIYFINKQVYPEPQIKELTDFASALEPVKGSIYETGDRSESILNEVLKHVVDSANNHTICLLISDCIYSLKPTKDTKGSLSTERNGTMDVFLSKFKDDSSFDMTTEIYKMNSGFNGNYFPYNYDPKRRNSVNLYNKSKRRPYYIWAIGDNNQLALFEKKVSFKTLTGFDNSYTLFNSGSTADPYYTILKETRKIGSFRPADRKAKEVKSITEATYENGTLQFAVAIDLSHIPVDGAYLLDKNNYKVPDGFEIKSIDPIDRDKLSAYDMGVIESTPATHFITVSTTSKYAIRDLELRLMNNVPQWVENSNSMDDSQVENELDKTFGISYLVKGVADAYEQHSPENANYIKIRIKINN
jgi:hypothetical protein